MWSRRAGTAVVLVGMALLGLLDVGYGVVLGLTGRLLLPFALVQIAIAVATAVVWLGARRLGPGRLAVAATLVAACSLGTTLVHLGQLGVPVLSDLFSSEGSRARPFWGLAESCGLLGVGYALARWARPGPALVTLVVTALAVAALPLRTGMAYGHYLIGMTYALLAAGAATTGMYFRMVDTARERQLAAVRAEQRAEFARDLHDFIAHHVTGIVVQAQGARYVAEREPQRAVAALEQIEQAGAQTMAAMRRMVEVLRGQDEAERATAAGATGAGATRVGATAVGATAAGFPTSHAPVAPLAGLADVPDLVRNFTTAGPVPARLHTEGRLDDLPVEVTSSAYRVVMEALTNVRQHATRAARVDVRLSRTPQWLLVRVTNDGPAPPGAQRVGWQAGWPAGWQAGWPAGRQGFGLVGLTERVGALGGRLRAGPGIDGGWEVDVALPLAGPAVIR